MLRIVTQRFAKVVWTPGNHDLWTPATLDPDRRGVAHYERLVKLCRSYGVLTPEDPYAVWPGDGPRTAIVPTFALYDYSFRPDHVAADEAVAWAAETGVRCADEDLLSPDPFPTRQAWCASLVARHRTASAEPFPGHAAGPRQPLAAASRSRRAAARAAILDLVRNTRHGSLASAFSSRHRGLWTPPPSRDARAGRRRDSRRCRSGTRGSGISEGS